MGKTVISISDLHMPFHSLRALNKAISFASQTRPQILVVNGDLFDLYAYSKFPRNVNLMTPEAEVRKARYCAEKMFHSFSKANPKIKIFLTRGNHSLRLHKRISEKLPEILGIDLFRFDDLWKFDAVETILDPRDNLIIDGVFYNHGWFTKMGDTVKFLQSSCQIGHSHRAYVYYHAIKNKVFYECNSGHMSNPKSVPMSYTPNKIITSITSFSYKDDAGPRIILA